MYPNNQKADHKSRDESGRMMIFANQSEASDDIMCLDIQTGKVNWNGVLIFIKNKMFQKPIKHITIKLR